MGILRTWLAIVVVLGHAPGGALGHPLWAPLAVSAFYVISGFYMQLIITERFARQENWIRRFYESRALRILPLYYLVLLLSLPILDRPVMTKAFESGDILVIAATIFNNIFIFGQDILRFFYVDAQTGALSSVGSPEDPTGAHLTVLGQSWTLALELTFYLLAPFLLRRSTAALVLIATASLTLRLWLFSIGYDIRLVWWVGFFPSELVTFLIGSLGYRFYAANLSNRPLPAATGPTILVLLIGYGCYFNCENAPDAFAGYVVLVALCVPVLFAATRESVMDRRLGALSYPVYMLHLLVIDLIAKTSLPSAWAGVAALAGTIAVSIPVAWLIEEPIDRFRARRLTREEIEAA